MLMALKLTEMEGIVLRDAIFKLLKTKVTQRHLADFCIADNKKKNTPITMQLQY